MLDLTRRFFMKKLGGSIASVACFQLYLPNDSVDQFLETLSFRRFVLHQGEAAIKWRFGLPTFRNVFDLREYLQDQIQRDYRDDDLILINGVYVSKTEVMIASYGQKNA